MARAHNPRCAARWTRILQDWAQSGLKVAEFCRRRSIARPSFYAWKRALGQPARVHPMPDPSPARTASVPLLTPAPPPFLPVRITPSTRPHRPDSAHHTTLELALRGGRHVILSTDLPVADLARLLGALEGMAC